MIAGAVVLVLALVGGGIALSGGGKDESAAGRIQGAPEIFLEPVSESGPDPFSASVDRAPSTTTTTASTTTTTTVPSSASTATTKPSGEATAIRGVSGSQPGLYGGTRSNSSCDRAQLLKFLESNPAKAAAWAGVQGIQPGEIAAFIGKLTPVQLKADTRVTNHGFANGKATPRQAVLQAGTSVLVDERGEPRVRCACGNPLRLPVAAQTAPTYVGQAWPGFVPERTSVVAPAPAPVQSFALTDLATGQPFSRPVGGDGTTDTALASIPSSTTTSAPTTTTTAATTTTVVTRPSGTVEDVSSEGVAQASSTYNGNEFPAALSVDGDATTSWFSAGPGAGGSTQYTWTGPKDDFIATLVILNNRLHENPDFRTRFGFGHVRIEIFKGGATSGTPAFSREIDLAGSPDPNVNIQPNVVGNRVVLTFTGHEDPECGGFSELQVGVIR
jgi:uncharacterized protein DUF6777